MTCLTLADSSDDEDAQGTVGASYNTDGWCVAHTIKCLGSFNQIQKVFDLFE